MAAAGGGGGRQQRNQHTASSDRRSAHHVRSLLALRFLARQRAAQGSRRAVRIPQSSSSSAVSPAPAAVRFSSRCGMIAERNLSFSHCLRSLRAACAQRHDACVRGFFIARSSCLRCPDAHDRPAHRRFVHQVCSPPAHQPTSNKRAPGARGATSSARHHSQVRLRAVRRELSFRTFL